MTRSAALAALLAALAVTPAATAQTLRYRDPVFPQVDVSRDVAYGSAVNRFTGQRETLLLDRYVPRGDSAGARAAVVVVHGGGFVGGDKASGAIQTLSSRLARVGYLVVSINYRLAPRGTQLTRQVAIDAAHDFKAAVRFLRRNAPAWRVDAARIGAIGSSAGAITVLEGAYAADEGNSGNPGFSSAVSAVVDLWGFLWDPNDLEPEEAPVSIVHGTADPIVPFQNAVDLRDRAIAVGVAHELHPMQGLGHAPWNAFFQTELDGVLAFFFEHLGLGQRVGLRATPGFGSPGALELWTAGIAGDAWLIALAAARRDTPLGDLGVLCLDPAALVTAAVGSLPAQPRVAEAPFRTAVPGGLGGATFHWQAVHANGSGAGRWLTNCVTTPF